MSRKGKKRRSKWNENSVIRGAIRRVFSRSPLVQEVRRKVRIEKVQYNRDGKPSKKKAVYYQCALCPDLSRAKTTSVDHIEPVVDPAVGFVDWNTYVARLFCKPEGLQVVCEKCHDAKTAVERKVRIATKKAKKK